MVTLFKALSQCFMQKNVCLDEYLIDNASLLFQDGAWYKGSGAISNKK
jgi:hypothetical protein